MPMFLLVLVAKFIAKNRSKGISHYFLNLRSRKYQHLATKFFLYTIFLFHCFAGEQDYTLTVITNEILQVSSKCFCFLFLSILLLCLNIQWKQ